MWSAQATGLPRRRVTVVPLAAYHDESDSEGAGSRMLTDDGAGYVAAGVPVLDDATPPQHPVMSHAGCSRQLHGLGPPGVGEPRREDALAVMA